MKTLKEKDNLLLKSKESAIMSLDLLSRKEISIKESNVEGSSNKDDYLNSSASVAIKSSMHNWRVENPPSRVNVFSVTQQQFKS